MKSFVTVIGTQFHTNMIAYISFSFLAILLLHVAVWKKLNTIERFGLNHWVAAVPFVGYYYLVTRILKKHWIWFILSVFIFPIFYMKYLFGKKWGFGCCGAFWGFAIFSWIGYAITMADSEIQWQDMEYDADVIIIQQQSYPQPQQQTYNQTQVNQHTQGAGNTSTSPQHTVLHINT